MMALARHAIPLKITAPRKMETMPDRPRILAIDDDPGLSALIRATLGDIFQVEQATDSQRGLEIALSQPPDLILLDISMPGLSGYELCRALRREEATQAVPVIFLSALARLEDRLTAYEAGGDDFLGKPFDPVELTDKVEITLRREAERRQLLADKSSAFAAAMNALSTTSEIGTVLDFLRHSFACDSYRALADAIVETAAAWNLTAAVQLRGAEGQLSRNRDGDSNPLEAGVLATLADCGRIAALGHRLAVNYPHVTIMILDMPIEDAERNGRLRDDLAWLAEAADARVRALDNEAAIRVQAKTLERLVGRTGTALQEIEKCRQLQKASAVVIMQDMAVSMERAYMTLGLNEEQEASLSEALRSGIDQVIAIFDEGLSTDSHLHAITAELAGAVKPARQP